MNQQGILEFGDRHFVISRRQQAIFIELKEVIVHLATIVLIICRARHVCQVVLKASIVFSRCFKGFEKKEWNTDLH